MSTDVVQQYNPHPYTFSRIHFIIRIPPGLFFFRIPYFSGTPDTTGSPCSNEPDLSTCGSVSTDGGGETNVLMVTSSVRMFNRVHADTSHLGPAVPLHLVLVVSTTCFQQRFVDTSSTCNNSDSGPVEGGNDFLDTGGQFDTSHTGILVVSYNSSISSGRTSQLSPISGLLFNIADDGSLRHDPNRKDVADRKGCFPATVDELTGVHTLSSDEKFFSQLELVRIPEAHDSKGCSSSGVMDDIFDNPFNVTMAFGVI